MEKYFKYPRFFVSWRFFIYLEYCTYTDEKKQTTPITYPDFTLSMVLGQNFPCNDYWHRIISTHIFHEQQHNIYIPAITLHSRHGYTLDVHIYLFSFIFLTRRIVYFLNTVQCYKIFGSILLICFSFIMYAMIWYYTLYSVHKCFELWKVAQQEVRQH